MTIAPPTAQIELGADNTDRHDRSALERFVDAHRPRIERYVRRQSVRSWTVAGDVDDVCNDVFDVARRRFAEVRLVSPATARDWLLRVAEIRMLDRRRHDPRPRAYEHVPLTVAPRKHPTTRDDDP